MRTTSKDIARRASGQPLAKNPGFWAHFSGLLRCWEKAFPQHRTWARVTQVLVGLLACPGRSTLTNSIQYRGKGQEPWSADYQAFSRSDWKVSTLFQSVLSEGLKALPPHQPVVVALDDTSLPKTGTKISQARYCHNPLAPKFIDKPIMWAIRMLHAALIIPTYVGHRPLALSIAFEPVPAAKKPRPAKGCEVSEAEQAAFQAKKKELSLTTKTLSLIRRLREILDGAGEGSRRLMIVADGSFTNGSVVNHLPPNTELIGRFRKDACLCAPLHVKDGKRIYGDPIPTPEEHRNDPMIPEQEEILHYGGRLRPIRFKDVPGVYWRQGTKGRLMRMLVVLPIPYKIPGKPKRGYNREAYLLTTDMNSPAEDLVQAYLNRWQIEVLHRDLKDGLGVGQVQAWSDKTNDKIHGAQVATYSMLSLAVLRTFEGRRTAAFPELPLWRKGRAPARPSRHEVITLLRNELLKSGFFAPPDPPHPPKMPKGWRLNRRETNQAA